MKLLLNEWDLSFDRQKIFFQFIRHVDAAMTERKRWFACLMREKLPMKPDDTEVCRFLGETFPSTDAGIDGQGLRVKNAKLAQLIHDERCPSLSVLPLTGEDQRWETRHAGYVVGCNSAEAEASHAKIRAAEIAHGSRKAAFNAAVNQAALLNEYMRYLAAYGYVLRAPETKNAKGKYGALMFYDWVTLLKYSESEACRA